MREFNEFIRRAKKVHTANAGNIISDSNGAQPKCFPDLATPDTCGRCGLPLKHTRRGACPSIPPKERWSLDNESTNLVPQEIEQ